MMTAILLVRSVPKVEMKQITIAINAKKDLSILIMLRVIAIIKVLWMKAFTK